MTPDFTLESDVIKIRGYTGYTASTKDDDKKITVRFHINKSCTEERILSRHKSNVSGLLSGEMDRKVAVCIK